RNPIPQVQWGLGRQHDQLDLGDVPGGLAVNERPLAPSLVGAGCQGPRSIWFGQTERPKLCAIGRLKDDTHIGALEIPAASRYLPRISLEGVQQVQRSLENTRVPRA